MMLHFVSYHKLKAESRKSKVASGSKLYDFMTLDFVTRAQGGRS